MMFWSRLDAPDGIWVSVSLMRRVLLPQFRTFRASSVQLARESPGLHHPELGDVRDDHEALARSQDLASQNACSASF
jgi:hypothetical protein